MYLRLLLSKWLSQERIFAIYLIGRLIVVLVAGGLAAAAYFGVAILLKVEEVALLKGMVMAKLGRRL
jgi:hypothetical protein